MLIPITEVDNYPKNEVIIIATGMQGEPVEALSQMAQHKHKIMNIEEGDSVFLAITASANMEVIIANTFQWACTCWRTYSANNKKISVWGSWLHGRIKNDD